MTTTFAHTATRNIYLSFFLLQICINFLIVAQVPVSLLKNEEPWPFFPIPSFAVRAREWYSSEFHDHLMKMEDENGNFEPPPLWFLVSVCLGMLVQIPFFVSASIMILRYGGNTQINIRSRKKNVRRHEKVSPSWFRVACAIYGTHASTVIVPMLVSIIDPPSDAEHTTTRDRVVLLLVYGTFFLFPAYLVVMALFNDEILLHKRDVIIHERDLVIEDSAGDD